MDVTLTAFAPLPCDTMPVIEDTAEPGYYEEWCPEASDAAERRLILNLIAENRTLFVRLYQMAVSPAFERPFDLYILKHSRRVVSGMSCDPSLAEEPEESHLYDGGRTRQ